MTNKELATIFFEQWEQNVPSFYIKTSGSTGVPKSIELKKEWLIWSALNTAKEIKPKSNDHLLCCIPIDKIGGLMMLVRSLVWNIPVTIIEPSGSPLLINSEANIASFTPFQCSNILNDTSQYQNLSAIRTVIIGGGDLSFSLEKRIQSLSIPTIFYHSYGMTETCSHIALRKINTAQHQSYFKPFDDVLIRQNQDQCIEIKCPFHTEYITSNDLIELYENRKFKMIGRADFVINTGGVKLIPEYIEQLIEQNIFPKVAFVVSSIPDDVLGDKVVLLSSDVSAFDQVDFTFLSQYSKYAIPKQIIPIDEIPLNQSNKIDRIKIKNRLTYYLT